MGILIRTVSVILAFSRFVLMDISFYDYISLDVSCQLEVQNSFPVRSVLQCATKCNHEENVAFHSHRVTGNDSIQQWGCVCMNRFPDSSAKLPQSTRLYVKRNHHLSIQLQSWLYSCMGSTSRPETSDGPTSMKTEQSSYSTQPTQRPTDTYTSSITTATQSVETRDATLLPTQEPTSSLTMTSSLSMTSSAEAEHTSISSLDVTSADILTTTCLTTVSMNTPPPGSSCTVDAALRFDNGTVWLFSADWIYEYQEWGQIQNGRTAAKSILSVLDISGPIDAAYANSTNMHIIRGKEIIVYSIDAKPVSVETRSTDDQFGLSAPSDVSCVLKNSGRFYVFSSSTLYDVSTSSSVDFTNNGNRNPLRSTNQNQNPGPVDACCNIDAYKDLFFVGNKHLTFQYASRSKGTWGNTEETIC